MRPQLILQQKALNLFNAALVTPTYYVYFTSSTIITSVVLFRGFSGTVDEIITVVMGFFVICSGVVLLQLSKSAKDVPDSAVFSGDLDQVRTIAEQEQPESEPKADAIRGTAAIIRRISQSRQKMELEEARRLHEEKQADLEPIGENEQFEWDGLRRRRTTIGSARTGTVRSRPYTRDNVHPPLGMSHFPSNESDDDEENRPSTGGSALSSHFMSFRSRAKSTIIPSNSQRSQTNPIDASSRSPMHPVPLTEISVPVTHKTELTPTEAFYGIDPNRTQQPEHVYGLPPGLRDQKTSYEGATQHVQFKGDIGEERMASRGSLAPTPPPHSAKRQFSFQNVFKKGTSTPTDDSGLHSARRLGLGSRQGSQSKNNFLAATEEERLGLVKGDTNAEVPRYTEEEEEDGWQLEGKIQDEEVEDEEDAEEYRRQRDKWRGKETPPTGGKGAFI
jgi:hypothetical protein